ncbi:MAG: tail fiber protein [Pseudomonadota bacterium]
MSDPYLGEITLFAGTYAPVGWALCDGEELPIAQNRLLYSVLGVSFGGDGETTFALPDLRGRVPVHAGEGTGLSDRSVGDRGGVEEVALSIDQMPAHHHDFQASLQPATSANPEGSDNLHNQTPAKAELNIYSEAAPNVAMADKAVEYRGGPNAHDNMMPFQVVTFVIALDGIVPVKP